MRVRRILVAHDFSEPADRALAFAARFAQALSADLHVVHVIGSGLDAAGSAVHSADQRERYARFMDQELERLVALALPGQAERIERHVVDGEPSERIPELAASLGADVICLGSTGKGAVQRALLGTVSQRILRTSSVPVLTIH